MTGEPESRTVLASDFSGQRSEKESTSAVRQEASKWSPAHNGVDAGSSAGPHIQACSQALSGWRQARKEVSKDPREWIYRYARQARLVDGADEVHRMLLNRELTAEGSGLRRWPVAAV